MLSPEPALSFTIPSIHDGTVLECRVYHPPSLAASSASSWKRHAAVIAHPYAPMGGCYDDAILENLVSGLVRAGYVVGSLNFRGAGHSAGRTSWTAKPERDDLASMIGFMVYYAHHLDPSDDGSASLADHELGRNEAVTKPESASSPACDKPATKAPSGPGKHVTNTISASLPVVQKSSAGAPLVLKEQDPYTTFANPLTAGGTVSRTAPVLRQPGKDAASTGPPVLLIGGYSYGAMVITQLLPPLDEVLRPFASPSVDSDAAQIRFRAQHLAELQNQMLTSKRDASLTKERNLLSPRSLLSGVRVGGDEGDRSPRRSHDSFLRRKSSSLDTDDGSRRASTDGSLAKQKSKRGRRSLWRPGPARTAADSSTETHGTGILAPSSEVLEASEAPEEPTTGWPGSSRQPEPEKLPRLADLVRPQPAYMLVSPLQGLVTSLTTMSFFPSPRQKRDSAAAEEKLVANPTLAVFGDDDVFVPVGKLRTWARKLSETQGSLFTWHEVRGAGHFWGEQGVLHDMLGRVGSFAEDLTMEGDAKPASSV